MVSKHQFHKGDRVQWSSGSGTATGTVQKRITEDQSIDGNNVSASTDAPRYLVENDSTGNVTGHRPDTLSKSESQSEGQSESSSSESASSDAFQKGDHVLIMRVRLSRAIAPT